MQKNKRTADFLSSTTPHKILLLLRFIALPRPPPLLKFPSNVLISEKPFDFGKRNIWDSYLFRTGEDYAYFCFL